MATGPFATGKINDTGIASDVDNWGTPTGCAGVRSDCSVGRDITNSDGTDGRVGFSFTKIAADGSALPASATNWSCVKDNVTGLIWDARATVSTSYTNYNDTSKAQVVTYVGSTGSYSNPTLAQVNAPTNATGYMNQVNVAGLCGAKDWRLPTSNELLGLDDYGNGVKPDPVWFPYDSAYMWASDSYVLPLPSIPDGAFGWARSAGWSGLGRSGGAGVRLVRVSPLPQSGRYVISADGFEVTDTHTGLIWRRCGERLPGDVACPSAVNYSSHANALTWAASIAASTGKAWRLPDIKELSSIVDRSRGGPALDSSIFPWANNSTFWSSSRAGAGRAWTLFLNDGSISTIARDEVMEWGGWTIHSNFSVLVR